MTNDLFRFNLPHSVSIWCIYTVTESHPALAQTVACNHSKVSRYMRCPYGSLWMCTHTKYFLFSFSLTPIPRRSVVSFRGPRANRTAILSHVESRAGKGLQPHIGV